MATPLDEKIEQLQNIVEKCFEFYRVTVGCSLLASERPSKPHESPIESLTQRTPDGKVGCAAGGS
jgi:hypothetical protein